MSLLQANISKAGYGKKIVLNDITLTVNKGDIVALIGPNGAGKSTLLKAVMGIIEIEDGAITYDSIDVTRVTPEDKVRTGISYIPQGNRVFTELTVWENLEIGGYLLKGKKELGSRIEEVLMLFPQLRERLKQRSGVISGGEKQQLALARALMLRPKLLLMDEPSLGLSPKFVTTAFELLQDINQRFGTTILIVEQKVREVLKIAPQVYALRMGKVVFSGSKTDLQSDDLLQRIFLT